MTPLTLLPLLLGFLLTDFENTVSGDRVRWKYTSLGSSAVSDWVDLFL